MLHMVWQGTDRSGIKIRVLKQPPSLGKFFIKILDEQDKRIKRKLRFWGQYLRGSVVYYLESNGDLVAYCVATKGGGRYSFSTSKDILLTPYYVKKEYRGNRYSEILINAVLNDRELKYEKVYDWIKKKNAPSLKCSLACGMRIVSSVRLNNRLVRMFKLMSKTNDDSGDWWLLCADRRESPDGVKN